MWPPQSVNTWPTPAPLSVRATSSPPVIQSEGAGPLRTSPAVIASASEIYRPASPAPAARTAAPRRPAAPTTRSTDSPPRAPPPAGPAPADVGAEPGDAGAQPRARPGGAARPAPRGARHRRMVREAGVPPRERAERRVVCEPARVARPVGERRAAPEARRVELGQDRADRHDTDLLGDEERTPRIGAGKNEAAKRPLEGDGVAGLEAPEPLRADSAGRHVGAEREPRGELRRRGDRVGADGLRAERDRHPLARGGLERGRLLQPKVDLQDLG